jgi:hypothetical protein
MFAGSMLKGIPGRKPKQAGLPQSLSRVSPNFFTKENARKVVGQFGSDSVFTEPSAVAPDVGNQRV